MVDVPTLILVPGLLCDRTIWRDQLTALAGAFRLQVPDLRHHETIGAMAEAVLADAPPRFSIAGHSMGARVALEVVRRAPGRVERLALLDTGVHPVRAGEPEARGALLALARERGMAALTEAWLLPMVHPARHGDEALMAPLRAMVGAMTPAIFAGQVGALLSRPDAEAMLAGIVCPVLIGVGSDDAWSPPAQHAALAAAIPGAKLVTFPDSGHMAPAEAPDAVTAALRSWLAEPAHPGTPFEETLSPAQRDRIERACTRLIERFAHDNDAHDAARMASVFAAEGSFARPSDPDHPVRGREALFAFFRDRPRRETRHVMANIVVSVESATRATARSYVVLYAGGEGALRSIAIGTFDDVLVREHGDWRFLARRGRMTFTYEPAAGRQGDSRVTQIPTTHVGSLPRGPELTPLLLARDQGKPYDAEAFDQVVQTAIDEAVRLQIDAGVTFVSDGELGKVGYSTYIIERLSGFGGHVERKPALDLAALPDLRRRLAAIMGDQEFTRAACVGPVRLVTLDPAHEDIRRFRTALDRAGGTARGFLNAASPGLITAFQPNTFYPSHEAYLADLVDAMRPEYEAIIAAGFDLQLDCPDLAMSRHTGYQDATEAEFLRIASANMEALNAATANIPADRMRMHVCWGNYEGPHDHDIPLERIIDIVLAARPATILFEAANPRHEHEWEIWRDAGVPDDKRLAPGLIDTCSNYIEHPELIAQRILRFTAIVGAERVIGSTDCGFGTFAGYGKIDPAVTWKKLRALREGADIAAARA